MTDKMTEKFKTVTMTADGKQEMMEDEDGEEVTTRATVDAVVLKIFIKICKGSTRTKNLKFRRI